MTKKKKKSKKKKKIELFRADRVLANRSGKTRAECFKLLRKNAISILEDDSLDDSIIAIVDDDHSKPQQDDPTSNRLRRVVVQDPSILRQIKGPKEKIPMNCRMLINQKFEVPNLPPLLTVYHKPKWMLSTMGIDAKGRRNLQDLSFAFSERMHPVGRLDYDSEGLLLFSSSGKLTQSLLHPKHDKEKEYRCIVTGVVQDDVLQARLAEGVELADVSSSTASKQQQDGNSKPTFTTRAHLLEVQHCTPDTVAPYLEGIKKSLPPEYNQTDLNLRGYMDVFDATQLSEIRLVVTEGKHRMVRRLLATCGHSVVSLKRERIGAIELGDLPVGAFRNLNPTEEEWAHHTLEGKSTE
ncbi:Ribosomal small subunit pseudouridine synthase A [Seminavis robusta]|uniref:Ribosomal small subunit pseudouridine synthase A n=1 Tax=Seminavis robusta TaxID=568900 RepID=A0A9N8E8U4_9STRA|nr:Ribosomal small subunit pseudouridine synthase A [Seminavis robusta]|eukprot:Sro799_g204190.1 Ribosomal small subunit pseudouridine synthase A (353) ;mRNA; f:43567-44625